MANLSIKDLPDQVHEELKQAARQRRTSLNSYVISLLQLSVDERWRRRMMREGRDEFRRFMASLGPMGDSTELLREDRRRGHR